MIDLLIFAGVLTIIYVDAPLFTTRIYDYLYLILYLSLLTIQIINSAFIHFVSDGLVLSLTIAILSPLVIKLMSRLNQQEGI